MIDRYSTDSMDQIWADETKFERWLDVEIAILRGWVEVGLVPAHVPDDVETNADINVARIKEIEERTRHDVAAFVEHIEQQVGEESGRWVHFGITSSDILDTALALQLRDALEVIEDQGLEPLLEALKSRAFEHKKTPSMGRTHGIHAEPTSLGLMFAQWYEELGRHRQRLRQARAEISVGQVSGAVGTYASVPPEVEKVAMEALDLEPAPISTQIISRERHASVVSDIGLIASSLEKFATEIRHRSRTEVSEFAEAFGDDQKGSSAMPHKRNPILSENVTGLARLMRSNVLPAMEDVALWHERDISHSSVERVTLPDSTTLLHFGLQRFTKIINNLAIDEEALEENIELSGDRHSSQFALLELIKQGWSREEAYELVQQAAFDTKKSNQDITELLSAKTDLSFEHLDSDSLATEHVDYIFEHVFNDSP